jgi:ribosomal protein S18 acetylase RimI-like enzyme
MNQELRLVAEPEPSLEDEQFVKERLGAWNVDITGYRDYAPANFFLRDTADAICGGVLAYVWGKRLHVDFLWLRDDLRGSGWGKRMLEAAHEAGREKGAEAAFLDTFDWQARPFYEHLGYAVVGEVDGVPEGHKRFYMLKMPL